MRLFPSQFAQKLAGDIAIHDARLREARAKLGAQLAAHDARIQEIAKEIARDVAAYNAEVARTERWADGVRGKIDEAISDALARYALATYGDEDADLDGDPVAAAATDLEEAWSAFDPSEFYASFDPNHARRGERVELIGDLSLPDRDPSVENLPTDVEIER